MYRTHTNGELRLQHKGEKVILAGWVQKVRDKGFVIWADLRDRYGITQLVFDEERTPAKVMEKAKKLGREFVVQIEGSVIERESKNDQIPTGEIEILGNAIKSLIVSCPPKIATKRSSPNAKPPCGGAPY